VIPGLSVTADIPGIFFALEFIAQWMKIYSPIVTYLLSNK